MSIPKITQYERLVRSEMSFAFTGGTKENLMLQAQIAIDKLLTVIGPNARGQFRFRASFYPDGDYSK